jgi:hypothetical protein
MTPPQKLSTENTEMDISVPSVLFSVAKCSHNHSSNPSQYYPELNKVLFRIMSLSPRQTFYRFSIKDHRSRLCANIRI